MLMIGRKLILQTLRIHQLFDKYPQLKDTNTRIDIMFYQLGEFEKYFKVYTKAYKILSDGYTAEARLSLANLLIQIDLFCVSKGWDIDMLRDEGYEHLLDKIAEVEVKGGEII
uniref:Uncharacterized protein n=1 Tax=viral metagenome TaxID=1070528 RepID=A0A6M3X881_9ZZZZ